MLAASVFQQRRQKLLRQLQPGSIAILAAAHPVVRNSDIEYPFRQDSDFYYLTGYPEPDALAVLIPGRAAGEYILFNQRKDPERESWTGKLIGQEQACLQYGADQAFAIDEIERLLPELLSHRQILYYPLARSQTFEACIYRWLNQARDQFRKAADTPKTIKDLLPIIAEMRLYKTSEEVAMIRKAVAVSVQAHERAMRRCPQLSWEYEVDAELRYEMTRQGCQAVAYESIIASGANTCILHYRANNAAINNNDLVLIDAGAEYDGYAADITRTFPRNGRFNPEQKAIYDLVLAAQKAVIAIIKPELPWNVLQETAVQVLTEGLVKLGLLSGQVDELIMHKKYAEFYRHGVSHYLGLDVHDVGDYKHHEQWRTLKASMVLTVEPGIYITPNKHIDKKWWNIGVRIEDDVLVTPTGCEVLSQALLKETADIEALMHDEP